MGEDLAYVAEQLGHADTSVTRRYYLRVMRMDAEGLGRLRRLVSGCDADGSREALSVEARP